VGDPDLRITPDDDIAVHKEQAIRLICRAFQSHETGLPEWIKNASDEYVRRQTKKEDRVIVVLFADNKKGGDGPASIGCLDFSGMTSEIIEKSFRHWADPDAAKQGSSTDQIQGGHGNGGKCYMTQMFEHYAHIVTVRDGKGSRYGVIGGDVRFGYVPNKDKGRDFGVPKPETVLESVLARAKCKLAYLPKPGIEAFRKSKGFTLVMGVKPKGYSAGVPVTKLIDEIIDSPQMVRSLELCSVYVVHNGKLLNNGNPLTCPEIPPITGIKQPREVTIPDVLEDPVTGEIVRTRVKGLTVSGVLVLKTSDKSMRWSRKSRHVINFVAGSEYVGFMPVPELDVVSTYRDRIYGECKLEAVTVIKQNDRMHLADSPLKRALRVFIGSEIQKYCEEFEAKEKRSYDEKEKNGISKINELLNKWKNKFLEMQLAGLWGPGMGEPEDSYRLQPGTPARIEVYLTHSRMGIGVATRPIVKFFDKDNRRIHPPQYALISSQPSILEVDNDIKVITSRREGSAFLHAETANKELTSAKILIDVVQITRINLEPAMIAVRRGGSARAVAKSQLTDGSIVEDALLIWNENDPSVARVSASGGVYGVKEGKTTISAGDDRVYSDNEIEILVGEAKGKGSGDKQGKGFPKIFVSGEIDRDPDTGEFRHFSSDDPPVYQDPKDVERNIWWINSASPLAKLYLNKSAGYGYESHAWRIYHVERLTGILAQIVLENDQQLKAAPDITSFILRWGSVEAQIHAAIATDLTNFISTGEFPAPLG